MREVTGTVESGKIKLKLSGHIDSNNAPQVEEAINGIAEGAKDAPVEIDAEELAYISSAGLRVILRLRKSHEDLTIYNVSSEVYEIFDMTGFTQMMTIDKAYRRVSVEGCEVIGEGANGKIYRIDKDNVVKVYVNADALEEIQHEREVARLALVLGIPTAISYDVVRVGDSYGSVFELLNARSFSKILRDEPERFDWCVREYVELLKKIHSTVVPEGKLPDMLETAKGWVDFMKDYLPEEAYSKLHAMIDEVPHDDHMIHGDYHTKNVELTDEEVLLIDMDTLAVGHPVFELASMYNAFKGFGEQHPETITKFMGFPHELAEKFWRASLESYLGTNDENVIRDVENKARIIGYVRLIRRSIRRQGLETEEGRSDIEHWKKELLELLEVTDSLLFTAEEKNELEIDALKENLDQVSMFIEEGLGRAGCPMKLQMQITMAVEEIFVNIASYAYKEQGQGKAVIKMSFEEDPSSVAITFIDSGKPYNPLEKEDPDITLSAEDRDIGGLGIYLVKETMDDVRYEHLDGNNILTIIKHF